MIAPELLSEPIWPTQAQTTEGKAPNEEPEAHFGIRMPRRSMARAPPVSAQQTHNHGQYSHKPDQPVRPNQSPAVRPPAQPKPGARPVGATVEPSGYLFQNESIATAPPLPHLAIIASRPGQAEV